MRACLQQFVSTVREVFWVVAFSVLFLQMVFNISAAWGQDASTGAIRGVVLDAQGAVITNADIVAIRIETGIRYHTATDSAGRFVLDLLPPGHYSARAEAEGMSPEISLAILVETGASALFTFQLKVAGPKESITVSDAPRMIETNPSSVSTLVDERAIKDLPLNGRRFTDLLPAHAGSDTRSAWTDVGFEWRSFVWRNSRIQQQFSRRWIRRQQWLLRAGGGKISRSLSIFERSGAGIPCDVEWLRHGEWSRRRRGCERGH
jgi:Carboxypeptidase regulatory-like domain